MQNDPWLFAPRIGWLKALLSLARSTVLVVGCRSWRGDSVIRSRHRRGRSLFLVRRHIDRLRRCEQSAEHLPRGLLHQHIRRLSQSRLGGISPHRLHAGRAGRDSQRRELHLAGAGRNPQSAAPDGLARKLGRPAERLLRSKRKLDFNPSCHYLEASKTPT